MTSGKIRQRGVTLIEMIVVIVVSGILLAIVGMFVRNQINSYLDVARRAALSDIGDGVLRRIARDVQGSLPNSLRPAASSSAFIEFVPIINAGRFASQATSDVATPLVVQGPAIDVAAAEQLVICNTGQTSADVYAGLNRRALTAGTALSSLVFSGGAITDYCSSNRYQVVSTTVVYAFDATARTLVRNSGCPIQNVTPGLTTGCTVKSIIATNVNGVSFNYVANALPSLGVLIISLVLSDADAPAETVSLIHQVNVLNSP